MLAVAKLPSVKQSVGFSLNQRGGSFSVLEL